MRWHIKCVCRLFFWTFHFLSRRLFLLNKFVFFSRNKWICIAQKTDNQLSRRILAVDLLNTSIAKMFLTPARMNICSWQFSEFFWPNFPTKGAYVSKGVPSIAYPCLIISRRRETLLTNETFSLYTNDTLLVALHHKMWHILPHICCIGKLAFKIPFAEMNYCSCKVANELHEKFIKVKPVKRNGSLCNTAWHRFKTSENCRKKASARERESVDAVRYVVAKWKFASQKNEMNGICKRSKCTPIGYIKPMNEM